MALLSDDAVHLAAFESYLVDLKGASPHTVKAYLGDLNEYVEYLAPRGMALVDCDPPAIRGYLGVLAVDHAAASRARKLASIKAFFKYLARREEAARLARRSW